MNNKQGIAINQTSLTGNIISWLFGIIFLAIGLINIFWGNDLWFGVFIALLSFVFFPPVNMLIKNIAGFSIPVVAKIVVALFILWASLGVGELFDKIEMMKMDL